MKTKIKIGRGIAVFSFFIILGGYRIIDRSVAISWLFAVFFHEMGHIISAILCGARIRSLTFDVAGAKMALCGKLLSYKEEMLIAMSGPSVNLIMSGLIFPFWEEFSSFSMMLGLLNLFPISGFDGYRILSALISLLTGDEKSVSIMKTLSFCATIVLWLLSVYLLLRYGAGFSAFILSCSLFSALFV